MPIDVARALGARLDPVEYVWDPDRVILYHLGLGAGNPATDEGELRYAYEANLHVLPTFGTIPLMPLLFAIGGVDGLDVNFALLLHGEHDLVVGARIPTSGKVTSHGRIGEIWDKGKGAVVVVEVDSFLDGADTPLFTNKASLFIRGEGGFGGEPGPGSGNQHPDRPPDFIVETPTQPNQALLYRLSGDKNPLHADPAFAALGGFDRPILHGLCSYGIVAKATADSALDGEVADIARFQARFAGVVFPGETIVTSGWMDDDRILLEAATKERQAPVISNAAIWKKER